MKVTMSGGGVDAGTEPNLVARVQKYIREKVVGGKYVVVPLDTPVLRVRSGYGVLVSPVGTAWGGLYLYKPDFTFITRVTVGRRTQPAPVVATTNKFAVHSVSNYIGNKRKTRTPLPEDMPVLRGDVIAVLVDSIGKEYDGGHIVDDKLIHIAHNRW